MTITKEPRMRLADFILANVEPILAHWEAFARSIWPRQAQADPVELRDHAEAILVAIVGDMNSEQSDQQQSEKSMGRGEGGKMSRHLDHASDLHGAERVDSGFKLAEVIAEYRALRASVIRLWFDSNPRPHATDLADLTRFHESIDQSLSRAVSSFTERVDASRKLFLAILGHDLRNPLNATLMLSHLLAQQCEPGSEIAETAAQLVSSTEAMSDMIRDLLDFSAADLSSGMPLSPGRVDLRNLAREVVQEIHVANPDCRIAFEPEGELIGWWDAARLRQVLSNLLANAVQHGTRACVLTFKLRGDSADVVFSIHNEGPPIPQEILSTLFDPLRRLSGRSPSEHRARRPGSLGLGLFITHHIVTAHGGTIEVTSTAESGTTFTVRLPRGRETHKRVENGPWDPRTR